MSNRPTLWRALAAAVAIALAASPAAARDAPANPNASRDARSVLELLHELPTRRANRVLLGQFAGYPNVNYIADNSFDLRLLREVHDATGKWPAIIGTDYSGRTAANQSDCRRFTHAHNRQLIDYWNKGGLVTLLWLPYSPDVHRDGSQCGARSKTFSYDLARVLPGGPDHRNWRLMLDELAVGLDELQQAGVVVMFRALHEVEFGWWWGKRDPELYKAVYRDMFAYLTYEKRLNNVLWMFVGHTMDYYPGDAYVDIASEDVYGTDVKAGPTFYDFMTRYSGKPYAFAEYGPAAGDGTGPQDARDFDWPILIDNIRAKYPRTSFVQVWADNYRLGNPTHRNLKALIDDPWIVDRDELKLHDYLAAKRRAAGQETRDAR